MSFFLSLFGKLAGFAALGPVGSIFSVVFGAIKTLLGWIWDGFQTGVSHPAVWALVACGFFGGVWYQHHKDKNYIEAAKIETANVVAKVRGAQDVEAQKAKAAIAARDAAKMLPLLEITAPVSHVNEDHPVKASVPPLALDTTPDRVRKPATIRRSAKCDAVLRF